MSLFDTIGSLLGQSGGESNAKAFLTRCSAHSPIARAVLAASSNSSRMPGSGIQSRHGSAAGKSADRAQDVHNVLGADSVNRSRPRPVCRFKQSLRQIAQHLPQLVDHITPNGELPSGSNLLDAGLAFLKSRMGGGLGLSKRRSGTPSIVAAGVIGHTQGCDNPENGSATRYVRSRKGCRRLAVKPGLLRATDPYRVISGAIGDLKRKKALRRDEKRVCAACRLEAPCGAPDALRRALTESCHGSPDHPAGRTFGRGRTGVAVGGNGPGLVLAPGRVGDARDIAAFMPRKAMSCCVRMTGAASGTSAPRWRRCASGPNAPAISPCSLSPRPGIAALRAAADGYVAAAVYRIRPASTEWPTSCRRSAARRLCISPNNTRLARPTR